MTDQREAILARLLALLGAVEGVASSVRNSLDVSKLQRPAVVVLDGAEQFVDTPMLSRGQVAPEIQRMDLMPLVAVHVRANNAVDAGTLLSLYRSRVVYAVLNDSTLISALGPNGRIRYEGATVAPPAPEGNEHRIDVHLAFNYVLRPADLGP
jgi:hypothetical protein